MRQQRPMTFQEFQMAYYGPQRYQQMYAQQVAAQQYPGAQAPQGGGGQGSAAGGIGGTAASALEAYNTYKSLFGGGQGAASAASSAAPAATQAAASAAPTYAAYGITPEVSASEAALSSAQAGPTVSNAAALNSGASGTPLFDVGGPSYAGYLGAAIDAYQGYNNLKGDKLRDEQKATRAQQDAALAVADVYTGGLAGLAERGLRGNKTTRKWMEKLDKLDAKTNPASIIANRFATDEWKTEGNRLKKLEKSGVTIPEQLRGAMNLTRGRSKGQLVKEEQAKIDAGKYGNTQFAQSRNEKDLKPEDIWGYSAFFEKYGNDWLGKMNEQQRRQIAQRALDSGAVNEAKGSINVDWNKVKSDDIYKPQPTAPIPGSLELKKPVVNPGQRGQDLLNKVGYGKIVPYATTPKRTMTIPRTGTSEADRKRLNLR